jgi:hypothetical protein
VARRLSGGLTASAEDRTNQEHREDRAFTHESMLRTKQAFSVVNNGTTLSQRFTVHSRRTELTPAFWLGQQIRLGERHQPGTWRVR